jgi:hypothetical protein
MDMSDQQLAGILYPSAAGKPEYRMPDYEYVYREMQRKGVTLNLLWLEYVEKCRLSGDVPYGVLAPARMEKIDQQIRREAKTWMQKNVLGYAKKVYNLPVTEALQLWFQRENAHTIRRLHPLQMPWMPQM